MSENTQLLIWVVIWVSTITIAALTTGYVLVSVALARVHRQRATADWVRARDERERVEKLYEKYAKDAINKNARRAAERRGLLSIMGYDAGVTTECTDPECEWAPTTHLVSWHAEMKASQEQVLKNEQPNPDYCEDTLCPAYFSHIKHRVGFVSEDGSITCTTRSPI